MPDVEPLVIGPDGRISATTPSWTRSYTLPPPVYFRGSGDPISNFLARMTNDMINAYFWTPETITEGFTAHAPDGGLSAADIDWLANEFSTRAKNAVEKAARDAKEKLDDPGAVPDEGTGYGQPR